MNSYLEKYSFCDPHIKETVHSILELVVVIPSYNEPNLIATLESLSQCLTDGFHTEVLVVINHSENTDESIKQNNHVTIESLQNWINQNPIETITYHVIKAFDLPAKHAGVGLARKIGMDEAVYRLDQTKTKDGIIVCLDADCTVDRNYLIEIRKHFDKNKDCPACHLNFQHDIPNTLPINQALAITMYELYLRWYKLNLEYCNHPYAYFTIGSCIAVRSIVYQKQGGMNKRQAGEDFYFLQKVFPLDNFMELNTACVYPSARYSDRVPFGTGAFLNQHRDSEMANYKSFNPILFSELKIFISELPKVFEARSLIYSETFKVLYEYLIEIGVQKRLIEIISNSTDYISFRKRFFRWFNGLLVLQYLHYGQAKGIADQSLINSSQILLKQLGFEKFINEKNPLTLLKTYRKIERLNSICEKPEMTRF